MAKIESSGVSSGNTASPVKPDADPVGTVSDSDQHQLAAKYDKSADTAPGKTSEAPTLSDLAKGYEGKFKSKAKGPGSTKLMSAVNENANTPSVATYKHEGFAEKKKDFNGMNSDLGASKQEQAWLLAHASGESPTLRGNAGEGKKYGIYGANHPTNPNGVKQGDDREFGIYNIGYGVLRDFGVDAAKKQGLIPANDDPAKVMAKIEDDLNSKEGRELSSKVMLGMLREYGFEKAEALIRGGETSLKEYQGGFQKDSYDAAKWTKFMANNTSAYLNNEGLRTGDLRHKESFHHV